MRVFTMRDPGALLTFNIISLDILQDFDINLTCIVLIPLVGHIQ